MIKDAIDATCVLTLICGVIAAGIVGAGTINNTGNIIYIDPATVIEVGPSDKLIDALERVESNCNPKAIGDNGNAIGILQIHCEVIDDVNRIYRTKYYYSQRFNPIISREICRKYLLHYGNAYMNRTGKHPTDEVYARIWNGGPYGYSNASKNRYINTTIYWNKVKKYL